MSLSMVSVRLFLCLIVISAHVFECFLLLLLLLVVVLMLSIFVWRGSYCRLYFC